MAGYCSNTNKDNISLFSFPKDASVRRQWVKFVASDRCDEWVKKDYEPSKWAVLCSAHFDESYFEPDVAIKQSLGFSPPFRSKLLPDAVPTISGKRKRVDDIASSSSAVQKLTRKRVSTVYYIN